MKFEIFYKKGAAALSSILILSAILLAVGLAMSYSGFLESDSVAGQDKASGAFYAAEAGAKDAMQKIAKNKKYSYASPGYTLPAGGASAAVIVCHNENDTVPCPGIAMRQTEILSTGVFGANTKKIRVLLNTDAASDSSGKIAIVSWEEMAN